MTRFTRAGADGNIRPGSSGQGDAEPEASDEVDPEQRQAWFRSMWEGGQDQLPERTRHAQAETVTQPEESQEDANEDDGFGDDFDEEFQEGGEDDFGDFDAAEEAEDPSEPQPAQLSQQSRVPSILSSLVSSVQNHFAANLKPQMIAR